MLRLTAIAAVLVVAPATAGLSGCGGDGAPSTATTTPAAAAVPELAARAAAEGEIVVRGESSPASKGPYEFDGRYLVRFVQYEPQDDALDFTTQTPFTASLQRREGDASGAIALFGDAKPSGRRDVSVSGRYIVDVSFGDFPYVLRFTPRR